MMSTAIGPFAGLGINVFNSCAPALMSTAVDSFCMSGMEPKFEHTSMVFSNLVQSPFDHPKKKDLQPIPQGKGLALELELELMAMERRKVDSERREGWIEESNEMGTEVLPTIDKMGKEAVHPMPEVVLSPTAEEEPKTPTVGDDERMEDPPGNKHRNYGHYHEEGGPNHFFKVMLAPKLECIPMPLDFTTHFVAMPTEFKLKNNTGCS
ncbi:Cohesin subunit SA-1 [Hordeum vulgare]|nr:Cohesin subunit SA-1 [Hordeum vulgare]